jgi:hypothetical protein
MPDRVPESKAGIYLPRYSAGVPTANLVRFFLYALCVLLAGYAIVGRGFAYLGFPPLFIGEVVLFLGLAAALQGGAIQDAVFNPPAFALLALMIWTGLRTAPYWNEYGFDALRDAMFAFYSLFAIIVASLLLRRPTLLLVLMRRYKRFIPLMVLLAPVSLALSFAYPELPNGQPLFEIKSGDIACHFAAICAFALVGFTRLSPIALVIMLPTALVTFTQSREAIVAFLTGCCLAAFLSPTRQSVRRLAALVSASVVVVGIAATLDIRTSLDRPIAMRQLVANTISILGQGESEVTESTKEWRLMWWSDIINYTVYGEYFWEGKGFGVNLANSDGYQTIDIESGTPLLRSPHSAHMTMLARGGVPGFTLWILSLGSWFVAVLRQFVEARRLRDQWWVAAFAWLLSFWTVIVVSASFDVALEGPMQGIWFWTIHGIGIAAVILHQRRVATWRTVAHHRR